MVRFWQTGENRCILIKLFFNLIWQCAAESVWLFTQSLHGGEKFWKMVGLILNIFLFKKCKKFKARRICVLKDMQRKIWIIQNFIIPKLGNWISASVGPKQQKN